MISFLKSFFGELGIELGDCEVEELERVVNSNMNYFRMRFMSFYFEGGIEYSDIKNLTLPEIREFYILKTDLNNKELYYITSDRFRLTSVDRKSITEHHFE